MIAVVRILYFDCFSGASGDMVLGALIDAGVALDDVRRALGSLAISPDSVWTERVSAPAFVRRSSASSAKSPWPSTRTSSHMGMLTDHGHGHRRSIDQASS